jgi:hypothetical protein
MKITKIGVNVSLNSELLAASLRYRQRAILHKFKYWIMSTFFVKFIEVLTYDILKCGMWVLNTNKSSTLCVHNYTAVSEDMKYTFGGQDARTTRV